MGRRRESLHRVGTAFPCTPGHQGHRHRQPHGRRHWDEEEETAEDNWNERAAAAAADASEEAGC